MRKRNMFVKVDRSDVNGEVVHSYTAVELRNGNLYPLGDKSLSEQQAWEHIDVVNALEAAGPR